MNGISTNHPDKGAPMTLALLERCHLDVQRAERWEVVVRVSHQGDEKDDWEWSFAAFKLRIEAALSAAESDSRRRTHG